MKNAAILTIKSQKIYIFKKRSLFLLGPIIICKFLIFFAFLMRHWRTIFGSKLAILPKKLLFFSFSATLQSYKKTKNADIKNLQIQIFLNALKNISTKNWTNLIKSEGSLGFFVRNLVIFRGPKIPHVLYRNPGRGRKVPSRHRP